MWDWHAPNEPNLTEKSTLFIMIIEDILFWICWHINCLFILCSFTLIHKRLIVDKCAWFNINKVMDFWRKPQFLMKSLRWSFALSYQQWRHIRYYYHTGAEDYPCMWFCFLTWIWWNIQPFKVTIHRVDFTWRMPVNCEPLLLFEKLLTMLSFLYKKAKNIFPSCHYFYILINHLLLRGGGIIQKKR